MKRTIRYNNKYLHHAVWISYISYLILTRVILVSMVCNRFIIPLQPALDKTMHLCHSTWTFQFKLSLHIFLPTPLISEYIIRNTSFVNQVNYSICTRLMYRSILLFMYIVKRWTTHLYKLYVFIAPTNYCQLYAIFYFLHEM